MWTGTTLIFTAFNAAILIIYRQTIHGERKGYNEFVLLFIISYPKCYSTELIRHKTFYPILSTTVLNIFLTFIIRVVQRFTIGKGARLYIGLGVRRHLLLPAVNWVRSWEKQSQEKANIKFQENSFCSFRIVTFGRTAVKKLIPSMFQIHWAKCPKTNFILRSTVLGTIIYVRMQGEHKVFPRLQTFITRKLLYVEYKHIYFFKM